MTKQPIDQEIFISSGDIWNSIKESKKKILACMLCLGMLVGTYQLTKPLKYTSQATFKTPAKELGGISKLFENLNDNDFEKSFFKGDSKSLFNSHVVCESVVKKLGLQVAISDGNEPGLFRRVGRNIATEYYFFKYKRSKPFSFVLTKDVIVPAKLFLKDYSPAIICKNVHYPQEFFSSLKIKFVNDSQYSVFEDDVLLGEAAVGQPFYWPQGNFTLFSELKSLKNSTFCLSIIPTKDAAQGLINSISIKKDKQNPSLLILKYTHPNRFLAAEIINSLMDEYRLHLESEAIKKSGKQVSYLEQRHEYSSKKLEVLMLSQLKSIEENLSAGEIVQLHKEIEFVSETQATYRVRLHEIQEKMLLIDQSLNKPPTKEVVTDFSNVIKKAHDLKQSKKLNSINEIDNLNLKTAHQIEDSLGKDFNLIDLQIEQFNYILDQLENPQFEVTSLNNFLKDSVIENILRNYSNLSLQILDDKNHTAKEHERIKSEMSIQRRFLINHILKLKDVGLAKKELLYQKLKQNQETLLVLLADEYEVIQNELAALHKRIISLPQKWFFEKKVEFDSQIYTKMIETITKMIESKNIALNMESLDSYPIDRAFPATLPKPPKILFFMLIASLISGSIFLCGLCLKTIFQGIRCNAKNMLSMGYLNLGELSVRLAPTLQQLGAKDLETLRKTAHYIFKNKPSTLLLTSKKPLFIATLLAQILKNYDHKKILIMQFSSKSSQTEGSIFQSCLKIQKNQDIELIRLDNFAFRQESLNSKDFLTLLEDLKNEWDLIIFENSACTFNLEVEIIASLSDLILHIGTEESYQELSILTQCAKPLAFLFQKQTPKKEFRTATVFLRKQKKEIKLHIRQIEPILESLRKRFEDSIAKLKK